MTDWKADAPFTHEQYKDRSGEEDPCRIDEHHYVLDEDGEFYVCTRCGDSGPIEEDE